MKNHNPYLLFLIILLTCQVNAQVIYERTYNDAFPSLKEAIELPDYSTVSFANNSPCYFGGWRHISAIGEIIQEGGIAGESTHSLRTRQIAKDSILVSCRVGPLDFDGTNFFKVALWTQDSLISLVNDTVFQNYWDDTEWSNTPVHYESFLIDDDHVLYQKGDTIFSKSLVTGQVDFQGTFFHITHVYPVKDGLMVFSAGLPPTYFNSQLQHVKTWLNLSAHPISFNNMLALDSFIVGINIFEPTAIHAVNVFNENSVDIDLSDYFTQIDSLVARDDTLIVTGRNGELNYAIQLNKYFEVIHETQFVVPDTVHNWALSFYPDRLYAWRTDGFSGYRANYRVAYQFLDPQPITYVDLEFANISVDSIFYWSPSDPSAPVILYLTADIINLSEDTLESLTIHYREEPFGMCDPGVYPSHRKNLETPPGDIAKVKFSVIVWAGEINKNFIRTFYVQHGNYHLDSIGTDNSFRLNYFVSKTNDLVPLAFSAYPNPFTDFISISDGNELIQLVLYDQTGLIVAKGIGQLDDLGRLPSGYYVLQAIDATTNRVSRVVKVE